MFVVASLVRTVKRGSYLCKVGTAILADTVSGALIEGESGTITARDVETLAQRIRLHALTVRKGIVVSPSITPQRMGTKITYVTAVLSVPQPTESTRESKRETRLSTPIHAMTTHLFSPQKLRRINTTFT
jgi:hypothetical protein